MPARQPRALELAAMLAIRQGAAEQMGTHSPARRLAWLDY